MCQVIIRQPPLQGARADIQLLCDRFQCRVPGRQQLRYCIADLINWNDWLAHGR